MTTETGGRSWILTVCVQIFSGSVLGTQVPHRCPGRSPIKKIKWLYFVCQDSGSRW